VADGETKGFEVAGVEVPIMVANIGGTLVATSSMCPHEDVSLLDGDRDGTLITCPGHAYEFDLVTGKCSHDPDLALCRYKVSVIDGHLYVDLI
jgi:nitrite reductase/ring-hydroxylating ferredoxin subunit